MPRDPSVSWPSPATAAIPGSRQPEPLEPSGSEYDDTTLPGALYDSSTMVTGCSVDTGAVRGAATPTRTASTFPARNSCGTVEAVAVAEADDVMEGDGELVAVRVGSAKFTGATTMPRYAMPEAAGVGGTNAVKLAYRGRNAHTADAPPDAPAHCVVMYNV